MDESRRANRARTLLGGHVSKAGLLLFDVQVRDINDQGAKLMVEPGAIVPDEFDLEIPRRGRTYKATVRWRDTGSVGVEFSVEALAVGHQSDDRIKQLEAENLLLKRRIADMAKRLDAYGDGERSAI